MKSQERTLSAIQYIIIILLWMLMFITPTLFGDGSERNWRAINIMWCEYAIVFVVFIINRFVLTPYLFFTKKYILYLTSIVCLLLAIYIFVTQFSGVEIIYRKFTEGAELLTEGPPTRRSGSGGGGPMRVIPPNLNTLIFSAIVIALDMGLNLAVRWMADERRRSEIESENMSVKLSNLQSQVSPHFFMNTLNNIHALVEIDPKKAQETIIELSNLMDYLLYEMSGVSMVSLEKELDFTNNYVNLMRLRYPKRVGIDLFISGDIPKVKLPPLLFLNFIENSFKYGVDYSKESFIDVRFNFSKSYIEMISENSDHSESVKRERKGLGISNARKRLDLIYGQDYTLDIEKTDNKYKVTLKVPINV